LPHTNTSNMKSKDLRTQRQAHYFAIIVLFLYIILNAGCNGFEFKSGMFDFKVNDHHHDAHSRNDSNSTGPLE